VAGDKSAKEASFAVATHPCFAADDENDGEHVLTLHLGSHPIHSVTLPALTTSSGSVIYSNPLAVAGVGSRW
jgi:hypothetical protein